MRTKSAAGFRRPESGPTEDTLDKNADGTTRHLDVTDDKADDDVTGKFHHALEALEATYDTCRQSAEASLRKVARKR